MDQASDGGVAASANSLRVIQLAMVGGIVTLALVAGYFYKTGQAVPDAKAFSMIRLLSIVALAYAAGAGVAAPMLYAKARGAVRTAQSLQAARLIRAALGEGVSLLGLVVCLLAAHNGVLRAQPLYWLDAAPAALVVAWMLKTLPDEQDLRRELSGA